MRRAILLLTVVALIALGFASPALAGTQTYTAEFIDAPVDAPAGCGLQPFAMNDAGQVVGRDNGNCGGVSTAFFWENGTATDLGALAEGVSSVANGINSQGQVVGVSRGCATCNPGQERAFLWENGTMTDLGALLPDQPHYRSNAADINDSGQVAGQWLPSGDILRAVMWQNGTSTDLGWPEGSTGTNATAINASGVAVGTTRTNTGANHAAIFENGSGTDLGTLPGYTHSSGANDINASGQVVGTSHPSSGSSRAFLYENGQMQNLGTLQPSDFTGANHSEATAINDSGQVVGVANDTVGRDAAFLYENGQMIDLFGLLAESEKQTPVRAGWARFEKAFDINNKGQIIGVGMYGTEGWEESRAFLLTPDITKPTVKSTTPLAGATDVNLGVNATATFSEEMNRSTITKSTVKLFKVTSSGATQVTNVTVTLNSDGLKATLNPYGTTATLLATNTKYKAVVTTGAQDLSGNPLDQNRTTSGNQQKTWTFTTKG